MAERDILTVATAAPPAPPVLPTEEEVPPPPQEPALLDLPEGMAEGPVDLGWAPQARADRHTPSSPLNWIAGGLAVFLIGGLVLSAAAFVEDQFARSTLSGAVTLAVFGAGLAAVLRGAWLELASLRRLRCVDTLRAALMQEEGPLEPARRLALDWLDCPPPPAGGGHRPTRRCRRFRPSLAASDAAHPPRRATAPDRPRRRRPGADLLGQGLAGGVLAHLPGVRQVAAAISGAGLTALRLRHLAKVTARACSPLGEG